MADDIEPADDDAAEKLTLEQSMAEVYDRMQSEPEAPLTPSGDDGLPSAEPKGEISEGDAGSSQRLRGPDGKFAKATADDGEPTKEISADTTADLTPKTSAPASWASEKRTLFEKAEPALRDYIALRENQMNEGVAKLKADYEGRLAALNPIAEVLRPVEGRLRANNVHPARYVANIIAAEESLRSQPQQTIRKLAEMYGVDLASLASGGSDGPTVDPQIAALHVKTQQLENYLRNQQMQATQAQYAELGRTIEGFKADPKNSHFDEVREDMAALLQAGRAQDLQTAYDMAIYANPVVRAKVLESQRVEAERARQAEAQAKAATAKKIASTNVATKGTGGMSPSGAKTFEETMASVYDRVTAA